MLVWTDERHAAVVGRLLDALADDASPVAIAAARGVSVDRLAAALELTPIDDPRRAAQIDASWWLVAGGEAIAPELLDKALGRGVQVAAIEPVFTRLDRWPRPTRGSNLRPGAIHRLPDFFDAPGWTRAAEPLDDIGRPRCLSLVHLGRAGACSLLARLVDAWAIILALTELPVTVDAALAGLLEPPPSEPEELAGNLTAHARHPDGAASVIQVSERAGRHHRELSVVGELGSLCVSDSAFELWNAEADKTDAAVVETAPADFVGLTASQLRRRIQDPKSRPMLGAGSAASLACALACLLSARTGEPESPRNLLSLNGHAA